MKQVHDMGTGTLRSILLADGASVKARLRRESTRRYIIT